MHARTLARATHARSHARARASSFILGFVLEWRLTLVILAMAPLIAIVGYVFMQMSADAANDKQGAYARAGAVANEVLTSIRTVVSFNGHTRESARYDACLADAEKETVRKGLTSSLSSASVMLIVFVSYGRCHTLSATLSSDP